MRAGEKVDVEKVLEGGEGKRFYGEVEGTTMGIIEEEE